MRISGPGDQRPADAEAGAAQLLGGHDHRDVLGVAALAVAAVVGGDAQAERTDLAEPGDDLLRDVAVGAVDVLGVRGDDVVGERAERVLHHLHVVTEVTWTGLVGEGTHEVRIPVGDHEVVRPRQRHRVDAPQLLAADQLADEVVHDVGDERARDPGLDVALGAVVEQGLGGGDGRCRVGQVVGEHLVHVGPARRRQLADRGADGAIGELDDVRGGVEIGRGERVVMSPNLLVS